MFLCASQLNWWPCSEIYHIDEMIILLAATAALQSKLSSKTKQKQNLSMYYRVNFGLDALTASCCYV